MRTSCPCLLLLLLAISPARSQFSYPSSASTRVYLGHLVDGPSADQNWTTTIILTNPSTLYAASVRLSFFDNDGHPLALDFGQGASPIQSLTVPIGGTKVLTTLGTSTTGVAGWGIMEAVSTSPSAPASPVSVSLLYRAQLSGGRWWDVATAGTGSMFFYSSYGTRDLGVAVANPSASYSINLLVTARKEDGSTAGGPWTINLPPLGHRSWNLNSAPTNLSTFSGTIQITSSDPMPSGFVALSLNYRDPVISPLPPGDARYPAPSERRPQDALAMMQVASTTLVRTLGQDLYDSLPDTVAQYIAQKGLVLEEEEALKATYKASDDSVHLSHVMVESLGSSEAGLAFLVGHYVARGVLQRTGLPGTGIGASSSIQTAADALSLAAMLTVGYDPGGMADFLGRLSNAQAQGLTIDFDLLSEFGPLEETGARLTKIWSKVMQGCTDTPQLTSICQKAHDYWHQHYPNKVP